MFPVDAFCMERGSALPRVSQQGEVGVVRLLFGSVVDASLMCNKTQDCSFSYGTSYLLG